MTDDAQPRYSIRTKTGKRGPFTLAQVRSFAAAGKLPPVARINDVLLDRTVRVADLLRSDVQGTEASASMPTAIALVPRETRSTVPAASRALARGPRRGAQSAEGPEVTRSHGSAATASGTALARIGRTTRWLRNGICVLLLIGMAAPLAPRMVEALRSSQLVVAARKSEPPTPDPTPPRGHPASAVRAGVAPADEPPSLDADFAERVSPFLAANCISCHGPERQRGEIRFDQAIGEPGTVEAMALWKRALEQLEDGSMPPQQRPRPDVGQQAEVVTLLRAQLARASSWPEPPLRRLTRVEYANAVVDLLGIREDLHDLLPDELGGSEGFTNEAEQLQISPHSVEAYLKAALRAASAIIQPVPMQHWTQKISEVDPMTCGAKNRDDWWKLPAIVNHPDGTWAAVARGDTLVFWDLPSGSNIQRGVIFSFMPITLPAAGIYRIRLRACALRRAGPPARLRITYSDVNGMDPGTSGLYWGKAPFAEGYVDGTFADEAAAAQALAESARPDLPLERIKAIDPVLGSMYERAPAVLVAAGADGVSDWLKHSRPVPKTLLDQVPTRARGFQVEGRLPAGRVRLTLSGEELFPDRLLFVTDGLELEGPLPNVRADGTLAEIVAHERVGDFVHWLARTTSTAFRRAVTDEEAASRFQHFQTADGGRIREFAEAARLSLASVLCSPEFITVLERPREDPARPRVLAARELALRLSLFLWRGLPDQALLTQATSREGLAGAGLSRQVERMLGDARIARFIHDFDEGWLGLDAFESNSIDPKMFPHAQGNHLRESLRREPDEFMAFLIASDASILDILHSDYVVINQCLAGYYGLSRDGFGNGDEFHVVRADAPASLSLGDWWAIGPFAAPDAAAAHRTTFAPEQRLDLKASYGDGTLKWITRPEWRDGQVHELSGDNSAWYLTRTIRVITEQDVVLSLGSDDGFKLWCDGSLVIDRDVYRGVAPDQDSATIHLTAGEHRLLLKVNNGGGGYAFYFRVVGLPDREFRRGGVLGMGAILMQTSQSTRTSPVRRGVWFLENLLGTKPPPPPANVKQDLQRIEVGTTGQLSRRQMLEAHRGVSTCANCHARFDPLGFALENFGPDGLWRTNELIPVHVDGVFQGASMGPAIDPSGELPGGRPFADLVGLERLLVEQPKPFVRAFARKLLAFAVGRKLGPQDDPSVDAIVTAAFAHGFRIHAVLTAVVESETFRNH